jgi:hypothetical protein
MAEVWSLACATDQAGLARSSLATWGGWSNPKKFFKKIILKFFDFSKIFYCILINIGLYFYTVKIQIRY